MPRFSESSKVNLSQCAPELQLLFNDVINYFDCTVICGHRTEAEQDRAVLEGKSKAKWPASKHNCFPSHAVDVLPCPISWKDTDRMHFFAGFVMAMAIGKGFHIRWGGDWNGDTKMADEKFRDLPHFEIME